MVCLSFLLSALTPHHDHKTLSHISCVPTKNKKTRRYVVVVVYVVNVVAAFDDDARRSIDLSLLSSSSPVLCEERRSSGFSFKSRGMMSGIIIIIIVFIFIFIWVGKKRLQQRIGKIISSFTLCRLFSLSEGKEERDLLDERRVRTVRDRKKD